MVKLDHWAEDKRAGLKADLKELDDQIKALAKIAEEQGITIGSRTTNMDSMNWIRDGKAAAKPLDIKAKTITELDTYVGASKADQGLVGYFKPTRPNPNDVPDHLKELVEIQYQTRLDDYNDLRGDVDRLVGTGRFEYPARSVCYR